LKLQFWSIGKPHEPHFKTSIELFTDRLSRYYPVTWNILNPPKNAGLMTEIELKKKEGELVLSQLNEEDYLVALDERGKMHSSESLAKFIQQRANESTRSIVFLIGGAYGIDQTVLKRSQMQWSLSALTFPHQLVRLILAEQVYRACTILKNEKYHHS